jgi:hypothetical protein
MLFRIRGVTLKFVIRFYISAKCEYGRENKVLMKTQWERRRERERKQTRVRIICEIM